MVTTQNKDIKFCPLPASQKLSRVKISFCHPTSFIEEKGTTIKKSRYVSE